MTANDYRITHDEADEIFDSLAPYGVNQKGRERFVDEVTKTSKTNIYLDSGYSFAVSLLPTGYFAEFAEANDFNDDIIGTQRAVNAQLDVMFRKFEF